MLRALRSQRRNLRGEYVMHDLMTRTGALLIALAIAGCATTKTDMPPVTETEPATIETVQTTTTVTPPLAGSDNPLLQAWSGPYGGVPPFDQVRVEHFEPALEAAMAENLAEIDRIANDPAR